MHIIYTQEGGDKGYRYLHVDRKVPDHLRYEKGNPPPIDNAPMISMSSLLQAAISPHFHLSCLRPIGSLFFFVPVSSSVPPRHSGLRPGRLFLSRPCGWKKWHGLTQILLRRNCWPRRFLPAPKFSPTWTSPGSTNRRRCYTSS